MKTIEQHLQELPEEVRAQALKNMWWEDKHNTYRTLQEALRQAFNWSKSPEGYWFWYNVETDLLALDLSPEEMKALNRKNRQPE